MWNHSETPNCGFGEDTQSSYAIRDIAKGEELFEDYGASEWPAWIRKIIKENNVDISYFKRDSALKYPPGYKGPIR